MAVYTGDNNNNSFNGGSGDDIANGLGGDDILNGAGGDDRLDGGLDQDIIAGDEGEDTLIGGDGYDRLYSFIVSPDFQPPYYDNPIESLPVLDTGAETDTLSGGGGNDSLFAGYGDNIDGGAGEDFLYISFQGAANGVSANFRLLTGSSSINIGGGTISNIEYVDWIEGSEFGDFLAGGNSNISGPIFGRGGDDHIISAYLTGNVYGGDGNDTLDNRNNGYGTNQYGEGGNDRIIGGDGYERLEGGDGDDRIDGNYGYDTLFGGAGDDVMDGGSFGDQLFGDAGNDTLYGAGDADEIDGGSGDDILYGDYSLTSSAGAISPASNDDRLNGGTGADRIYGDTGNDTIEGGSGNDVLAGGDGHDTLFDDAGNDQLAGEEGNDSLFVDTQFSEGAAFSALIDGGNGNDSLTFYGRANLDNARLLGRDGDDNLTAYRGNSVSINAGAGSDFVLIDASARICSIALGGGSDVLALGYSFAPVSDFRVLDFEAGSDGDQLQLQSYLQDALSCWDSTANPFATGHLRLGQSGGDAILQIDLDGGADGFEILATLDGVDARALTVDNLGFEPISITPMGTAGADRYTGSLASDEYDGLAGDDILNGRAGADRLFGGRGNDLFYVDNAGDRIFERAGEGVDRVISSISFTLGEAALVESLETDSGRGVRTINLTGNQHGQTITGNDGDNRLKGGGGRDTLIGRGGDDRLYVDSALTRVIEAAGGGDDRVYASVSYSLASGQHVETLSMDDSAGTKAIALTGNSYAQSIVGNAGGNRLTGGGGADRLFGLGGDDRFYVDSASDVVVEAAGGGNDRIYSSASYVLATGQHVETLSTNDGAGTAAINLTGNSYAQALIGNAGSNSLNGGGGADRLFGFGGNDRYYVDSATDTVYEAANGGTDRVFSSVSYTLAAGQHIETLAVDDVAGTRGIALTGNSYGQTIIGNAGANTIDGKGGNDILSGGGGSDTFAFTSSPGAANRDRILDFDVSADGIALDSDLFGGLTDGRLGAEAFAIGSVAQELDDRIIYNPENGALLFDIDGKGGAAAVQFAILDIGLTNLGASDFLVI